MFHAVCYDPKEGIAYSLDIAVVMALHKDSGPARFML